MRPKEDLVFPPNYSPAAGYPTHILNELYNTADVFVTTHLGEGWGLSVTEAMAAGVPVIAPNNTSMPEILGENSERGHLYECRDPIYVDNSGYRMMGSIDEIVNQMLRVHRLGWKHDDKRVIAARQWVEKNNWSKVCGDWIGLFSEIDARVTQLSASKAISGGINAPTFVGELL